MENTEEYISLFKRLESFYILITIHDIQEYETQDLRSLAHRLEGQLVLTPQLEKIHSDLTQKSDSNIQDKKRKKKQKKQAQVQLFQEKFELNKTNQSSSSQILSGIDELSLDQSMLQGQGENKWEITKKFKGVIYDGKIFMKLKVGLEGSRQTSTVGFYVKSENKESTISLESLRSIGYQKKGKNQVYVILEIEGSKHKFFVVEDGPNTLGLQFLSEQKVLLTINFRPECFNCTMGFSS